MGGTQPRARRWSIGGRPSGGVAAVLLAAALAVTAIAQAARPGDAPELDGGSDVARGVPSIIGMEALAAADSLLAGALAPLLMAPGDLGFRADYEPEDAFRLQLVEALLRAPQRSAAVTDSLAAALSGAPSLREAVARAAQALDAAPLPGALPRAGRVTGFAAAPRGARTLFRAACAQLVQPPWRPGFERAFAGLGTHDRETLRLAATELLSLEEPPPDITVDELAAEAAAARQQSESFLEAAARVDRVALLGAARSAAAWSERLLAAVRALPGGEGAAAAGAPSPAAAGAPPASGDVLDWLRLPDGRAAVLGGPGATVYHEACALTIDLGGDDLYLHGAGGNQGRWGAVAIAIDVAGDDLYRSAGRHGLGAAAGGAGILVDLAGNDLYQGGDFGLGAALLGLGVVLDGAGDDRYLGEVFSQGAGCLGVGMLRDLDGSDLYQGSAYCQGFGFVGGLGMVDDRAGSDVYLCQPRFSDLLRDETTTLSLAQGFGYGLRPYASGGIGLLVDRTGNDRYVAEVFGQGAAYWYALGGLVDGSGSDHYDGFNYAQGAGVHIAIGVLADGGGDDRYRSKGVSQGCGHDLAVGYLLDAGGDDRYAVADLSHGAGNANGCGLLVDRGGDDVTAVRRTGNTLGYGNFRRHYGSIGLAVHAGGTDRYLDEAAAAGSLWRKGIHGLGVDAAAVTIRALAPLCAPPPAPPGSPAAERLARAAHLELLAAPPGIAPPELRPLERPLALPDSIPPAIAALEVERLFVRAASGEPRFAAARQAARAELVRRGAAVVPALVARLGTRVARDRHALKDLFRTIGAPAVRPLAAALGDSNRRVVRAAAWCLERMETTGAEAELLDALAEHPSWRVRAVVAGALGRDGTRAAVPLLVAALADSAAPVRRAAAFAVGELALRSRHAARDPQAWGGALPHRDELEPALAALVVALDDPSYGARDTAARALGRAGPWATARLVAALPAAPARRLGLLLEALASGGDPRCQPALAALAAAPAPAVATRARLALSRLGLELEVASAAPPANGEAAAANGEAAAAAGMAALLLRAAAAREIAAAR